MLSQLSKVMVSHDGDHRRPDKSLSGFVERLSGPLQVWSVPTRSGDFGLCSIEVRGELETSGNVATSFGSMEVLDEFLYAARSVSVSS